MTGKIALSSLVLPVGVIKEKISVKTEEKTIPIFKSRETIQACKDKSSAPFQGLSFC